MNYIHLVNFCDVQNHLQSKGNLNIPKLNKERRKKHKQKKNINAKFCKMYMKLHQHNTGKYPLQNLYLQNSLCYLA